MVWLRAAPLAAPANNTLKQTATPTARRHDGDAGIV